jgi:hypothetical protein
MAGRARAAQPLVLPTALVVLGFGLLVPPIAAYLIVVALVGPSLRKEGLCALSIQPLVLVMGAGAAINASRRRSGGSAATARDAARHGNRPHSLR